MSKSKKIATIISYIQIAMNLLYGLLATPLLLRVLGPSEHGVYTLCTSIVSYLNLFQFGFGTTFIRYYIKYDTEGQAQQKEELCGMFLEIFAIIAVITALVGAVLVCNIEAVFGGKISQEEYALARVLLAFVVANAVLAVVGIPFSALVTAHEEFVFQKGLSLAETGLKYIVLFPLLLLGYKSVALVAMSTVFTCITLLFNVLFCLKKLHVTFRFTHFDKSLFKEISGFSFFVFLQSVMDIFNWQIDRFLLARFCGSEQISIYSVGAQFNSIFISIGATITGFFVPLANQMVAKKEGDAALSNLMIRVGRIQFILTTFLLSAFIFFGKPFLRIYAGSGYENAYWVGVLLIAPLVLPLSMDLWYHIARAKALHKTSTTVFAAVALLNLLVSIPLCKHYGEIGAAAGTCIGMFAANNIFQIWYAGHVVKLDMKKWAKNLLQMIPALIVPFIAGTLIVCFVSIHSLLSFVVWAVFYTVLSVASYWALAFNKQERDMVSRPILRLFNRIFPRRKSSQ